MRWVFNFLFLALIFGGYSFPIYIWALVWGGLVTYYIQISKRKNCYWDRLILIEQKQLLQFYRFVGVFMDVPHIPVKVRKRKWLVYGLEKLLFVPSTPYSYLFIRSLIRYQDFSQLYMRVLLIAVISLYFIHNLPLSIILFCLFLTINALQLTGSWKRLRAYFWDAVYPISYFEKIVAFSRIIYSLLLVHVVILSIVLGIRHDWKVAFIICIIGVIASYGYTRFVHQRKMKRPEG